MKGIIFLILAVIAVSIIVFAIVITRDGKLVTPQGQGIVTLDVGQFEAFPLPDYAAKHVTDGPDHVSTPAFRTIEQYI